MPVPLKLVLESILSANMHSWQIHLLRNWADIVGPLRTRMLLEKVYEDTACIGVYDLHWMHELYLLSPTIIHTINTKLGGVYIKKVRFKLVQKKQLPSFELSKVPYHQHDDCVITKKLTRQELSALQGIKDLELRGILEKFLGVCTKKG